MTANYTRSDSLPSSPASTTAPVDFMDEHTPSESDNDIDRLLIYFEFYTVYFRKYVVMIAATLANKILLIMCCEFIIVKCILKIKTVFF